MALESNELVHHLALPPHGARDVCVLASFGMLGVPTSFSLVFFSDALKILVIGLLQQTFHVVVHGGNFCSIVQLGSARGQNAT